MVQHDISNAEQKLEQFLGRSAPQYARWLSAVRSWLNADAMYRSIALAASREYLLDHLAALRYALVFGGRKFTVSFEPTGLRGPDLCVTRDGVSATVEVTRLRTMHLGPPVVDMDALRTGNFMLELYGDPVRDTDKALEKVRGKYRQATAPHALIAVWNDDERLEEIEMELGLSSLRSDRNLPAGLEFVVYGSPWQADVLCSSLRQEPDQRVRRWMHDLEAVSINVAIGDVLYR